MHKCHRELQRTHPEAAFTLAEMMVVIVIIGLLATLVVPNVMQKLFQANRTKASVDISTIVGALKEYAINNGGKFPDSLEPLVTPDSNGNSYLDSARIPSDPWHHDYMYDPPGPGRPQPRVYSYGRDGQPGGDGEDTDIDNLTINNAVAR
jgi:general secretion pathway protein G